MRTFRVYPVAILVVALALLVGGSARAHCDSTSGPVIPEAAAALQDGDVTPVLKWVLPEHEAEVRAAFAHAVAVRDLGPQARDLADRFFLETLVRLHRAGEGAPYAGITDEPVDPIVAMADRALTDGAADAMIDAIGRHLARAIEERFDRAVAAGRSKDDSVEAGRAYVAAYVEYVHFVEGVHGAIAAGGGHRH
jgi:cytochrome c551/c552